MSVRLTNDLREKIQKKLLSHKFIKPLDRLADKKARFALKVYNDIYSKKERDLMQTVPADWLETSTSICVSFVSDYMHLSFNGDYSRYNCHREIQVRGTRREYIRMIDPVRSHGARKVYDNDHKLTHEHTDLQREEEDLHKEVHEAMAASNAALWSVNTLKQLLEVWPEVEEFVPEYALRQDPKGKVNLPALPIDDLNASFGLKKKTA